MLKTYTGPIENARPLTNQLKIAYFTQDRGACTYYRAALPLDTLHYQKKAQVLRIERGDGPDKLQMAMTADILVLPRVTEGKLVDVCVEMKEDGKKMISDYDDNVFDVNWTSNHYNEYGLKEVKVTLEDGSEYDVWKDGVKGFSLSTNLKRIEAIKRSMGQCDLVTTTTPQLASVLKAFNPNVIPINNSLNLDRWRKIDLRRTDEIKLVLTGGSSHFHDWVQLADVLPEILERNKKAKLYVFGQMFTGVFKNCPPDQLVHIPWEETCCYPYVMVSHGFDICLIPLHEDEFNACKSPIKFAEQGSLDIPCVISNVSPYKEFYDGENMVLVDKNDPECWFAAVNLLIDEPLLRAKIGAAARRTVEQQFDMLKNADKWLDAYRSLYNGNGNGSH